MRGDRLAGLDEHFELWELSRTPMRERPASMTWVRQRALAIVVVIAAALIGIEGARVVRGDQALIELVQAR